MMFCNNDNYMDDLYYYNQMPNNTYPYMNNMNNMNSMNANCMNLSQNGVMPDNMMSNNMNNEMWNRQNYNMMPNGMMGNNMQNSQNVNNLYPSLYRIVMPVISRVISKSNFQFLNEDVLNNMVDTVFNIVEGQIDYDEPNQNTQIESSTSQNSSTSNSTTSNTTSSNTSSTSNNSSGTTTRTTDSRQSSNSQTTTNSKNNRNDDLLRDIIKILILKELLSRNRNWQNQQFNSNTYYPVGQYNMNYNM